MKFIYFALGWLGGVLAAAGASRIDGPAPTYVFVIAGAGFVFVALVIWFYDWSWR
jgi:hypothetical protein